MTREEAIQELKELNTILKSWSGFTEYPQALYIAIDMAIEALHREEAEAKGYCHRIKPKEYGDYIGDNGDPKYHAPLEVVRQDIKDAPSADAVQGEWVDIDNYYRMATCSHCHKVTMFEKWGEYTKPYNFCPNCGAKMYKGGDDE